MRRGITLPELILVLAILGVLTGLAVPRLQRLGDSLAVQQAALEIVSAHNRARMSAVLQSRVLELSIRSDTVAIRVPGSPEALWHSPGPAAQGVALAGPTRALTFSPVGMTFGLSNGTYRLSRGSATRSVVVSRLGRVRIEP